MASCSVGDLPVRAMSAEKGRKSDYVSAIFSANDR